MIKKLLCLCFLNWKEYVEKTAVRGVNLSHHKEGRLMWKVTGLGKGCYRPCVKGVEGEGGGKGARNLQVIKRRRAGLTTEKGK